MSIRLFDKAKLKIGQRSSDRGPEKSVFAIREEKILDEAISELSALSLDQMMTALQGLEEEGIAEVGEEAIAPGEKEVFTLEEVYGALEQQDPGDNEVEEEELLVGEVEIAEKEEVLIGEVEIGEEEEVLVGEVEIAEEEELLVGEVEIGEEEKPLVDEVEIAEVSTPEEDESVAIGDDPPVEVQSEDSLDINTDAPEIEQHEFESTANIGLNEGFEPTEDSPISGVVKDEIVLSLLQSELVSMSQVFDAIRGREEGVDLWRILAAHPEANSVEIQAAVASERGYKFHEYISTPPTRSFIDKVLDIFPGTDLAKLVSVGLLPISLDIDLETVRHTVVVLSADPLDSRVQAALLSSPIEVDCRFSPQNTVEHLLTDVRMWLDGKGFSIDDSESESFEKLEPEHVEDPVDIDFKAEDDLDEDVVVDSDETDAAPRPTRSRKMRPDRGSRTTMDRVVKHLVENDLIDEFKLAEAKEEFESLGGMVALWRLVADLSGVSREMVFETAAKVYAFKHEKMGPGRPDYDFVRLTMGTLSDGSQEEMMAMLLIPFEHTIDFETGTGRIVFVTPDPTNADVNRLVHDLDLGRFELRYASESEIIKAYEEVFPRKNEYLDAISDGSDAFDLGMSYDEGDTIIDEDALEAEISRSKLINLFEASLMEAVRQGVSDIHMFPNPNRQVEIHFRIDGRLKKWHTEDKAHPEAFLAVVKDNSTNVDRFDRDSAQDGFIQRDIDGALIRFRVSILPIATANQEIRAESIVIRILDDRKVLTDISKLGMLDVAMERFDLAIRQPHGMVILTGPTGSGKSTTLVAALYQVVTEEVNVLTVEDPVEYIIRGVRQIKLSNKLDLEGALRAILRHDPDIVMVGEMRDKYTAELAIKLANTGHLTFSTLHTNDAPAAVSRLYKMGVEPFLIAYAINLVVAQRLIREVCQECKEADPDPDKVMMKTLGFTDEEIAEVTVYRANLGSGCAICGGNGYKGRRAVCETLYFTPEIRAMIAESGDAIDEDAIRTQAEKDGMLGLGDSARELVKMGATTLEEVLRMTSS